MNDRFINFIFKTILYVREWTSVNTNALRAGDSSSQRADAQTNQIFFFIEK